MITLEKMEALFILVTALSSICGLIYLFIIYFNYSKNKVNKLEEEKNKTQSDLLKIKEQYGYLNGKIEGITKLHESVLDKIQELNDEDND